MIVSAQEITKVICLSAGDPAIGGAGPTTCVARPRPRVARSRIRRLRQMLAAGTYSIPAEQVATKMIGRAICDQVAHLVDP